jgi:hypothetical protein
MPSWGSQDIRSFGDSGEEGEWDHSSGNRDYSQYAEGALGGLAAGMANSQPAGDFDVDQYAGFKGSGQGFMSGGAIGAIVGGATAQIGQFRNVNKALDNLDTSVEGVSYDAYGRPVYQGGNIVNANANINALNKGVRKLNKTHLDPATNVISSLTGTRRRMKRKRDALTRSIQQSQQAYNTADVKYRNQASQYEDYMERANSNNRMYNLYGR